MPQIDPSSLILIVVGAHLRAEMADRPLAQRLCQTIDDWLAKHELQLDQTLLPVVCCDLWYLNQPSLHGRPTISIGGPGVNALSAYYNRTLNAALVRDGQLVIQLDPEFVDLRVCLWGMDHELTVSVLGLFEQKHLGPYLRAIANQVEPS